MTHDLLNRAVINTASWVHEQREKILKEALITHGFTIDDVADNGYSQVLPHSNSRIYKVRNRVICQIGNRPELINKSWVLQYSISPVIQSSSCSDIG